MKLRPEHTPLGDPCVLCQFKALEHTVFHFMVPDSTKPEICALCKLPEPNHKPKAGLTPQQRYARSEKGKATKERFDAAHPYVKRERKPREPSLPKEKEPPLFLGVDGEGQGRLDHAYVFLGVSSVDGSVTYQLEDPTWRNAWTGCKAEPGEKCGCKTHYEGYVKGLSTEACLEFLISLPRNVQLFSFSFGYDLTKILKDLPNESLWRLFRPEKRPNLGANGAMLGPKAVKWGEYYLNLQGTKFTIKKGRKKITLWDIFKFFGTKFVTAIKTWQVGTPELWKRMSIMKDKRGEFDKEDPDSVVTYCLEECRCMAELAQKLTEAHDRVNLPLKQYHGAGSSAAAMLKAMGIKEKIVALPEMMTDAISRAFFGGRFENSVIGPIRQQLWNYDISSAYPYQLCFLPCLEHGTWKKTTNREDLESCSHALVKYGFDTSRIPKGHKLSYDSLRKRGLKVPEWGPFPYRFGKKSKEKGSICFPWTSPGGWVYRDEYLAGEKLFPHVYMKEAFVYETHCDCKPFERIPFYFLYRVLVGKDEGPGLTIKLAVNSCYGKLAQSIGNAMFNCWLWAGMITSGCRAQILELMGRAYDLSSILMIATDGICSRERLHCPEPKDTGTDFHLEQDLKPGNRVNNKPLGGWEEKESRKGMFLARPGIYWPLFPAEEDEKEIANIKGRGVGRGVVLDNHNKILNAWIRKLGKETVHVANVQRFCGAKTSIHRSGKPGHYTYTRADGSKGPTMPNYGQWIARVVELGFNPMPKRQKEVNVNQIGYWGKLNVRVIRGRELSAAYDKSVVSKEAHELAVSMVQLLEQPDVDYSEFMEEL